VAVFLEYGTARSCLAGDHVNLFVVFIDIASEVKEIIPSL
jgi:hypothetical protein